MAEVKKVKIEGDTSGAVKAMDNLSQATKEVAQEFNNAATFAERYGEELQPLTARMGEAEDRLYELANAGETASKEYQDLLETVSRYRKVQIQTDMAVDAAATTMAQKLGGALGGATAGFELMQGVLGTFGAESAEIEKQLLKVQSAMAIAQGVQGFKEAIPAITAFGTAIKTQAIAAISTLKGALITTGIGALVVALGFAADAMGLFGDSSEDAEEQQKQLDAQLEKTNKRLEDQKNLTETVSQTLDNRVRRELIDAKKRGASEAELNRIQADGAKDRIRLLEEEEKKLKQIYLQKSKTGSTKEYEAASAAWLETSQKLIDARLSLDEKEADITYQRIQDRKQQQKEAAKDQKEILDFSVQAFDEAAMEIEWIDKESFEKAHERDLADIQAEKDYQQAIVDAKNAGLSAQQDAEYANLQYTKELNEQRKQQMMEALEATAATLGQIADLFGEQSKAGKAAAIAEATINMFLSAQKAYSSTIGIPFVGPVLAPINAGLAIAAGIKNIKSIASVKTPGGGGPDPSIPSTNSFAGTTQMQAPSFNVVGNSGINQLAQLQQTPVQAYVVSGSVTTAQSLDRNRIENATL